MFQNLNDNLAPVVQAELRKTIIQTKSQAAITLGGASGSGSGARGQAGKLAGLEIPYKQGVVHGETALDVINGVTSFERMYAPTHGKMYVGLTQMGFTVEHEEFHEQDAQNGNLPETANDLRNQALQTYLQH